MSDEVIQAIRERWYKASRLTEGVALIDGKPYPINGVAAKDIRFLLNAHSRLETDLVQARARITELELRLKELLLEKDDWERKLRPVKSAYSR